MRKIQTELSLEQAQTTSDALDLFTRLCIGQLEEVANLVRKGVIPMANYSMQGERVMASPEVCHKVEELMGEVKRVLGYVGHHGIGHPHVSASGHRTYEIYKVLSKTLAVERNPNPKFQGVNYDGLGPRYTSDLEPIATVVDRTVHP